LLQKGKLKNVKYEMARLEINVMGISETKRPGEDYHRSDGFRRKPARSSNSMDKQ